MKNYLLIIPLLLLSLRLSLAQSSLLEDYVKEGLENNLSLKQQNFEIQKNLAALEEAKGLFMPQVSFEASYTLAGGGRTIAFPIGDLLNPVYGTLNQLTNSQGFPTIENVNEQFLPNNFHETKFRIIQPLFNSNIYFNYKAKQSLISIEEAKKQVFEQELSKDIKVAYLQYLQTLKVLDIYKRTDTLLNEVLRVNKKLVKNNIATPEIIYGAEYQISKLKSDVAQAQKNKQVAQSYFNFLLNKDFNEDIKVDGDILLQKTDSSELNSLESQATSQRKELDQLRNAMNANTQLVKLNEYNRYPSLNVVSDLGYQGFGYTFDRNQDFWLVQFSLSWDIFKGKQKRAKIQQSKIQQEKLNTQLVELQNQIKLQVQQNYYALEASRKAVESSQAALKSADRNFYLTKKKYEQGQSQYVALVDTQTQYTTAQISLAIAQYDYLIKKVALERAVGQ